MGLLFSNKLYDHITNLFIKGKIYIYEWKLLPKKY